MDTKKTRPETVLQDESNPEQLSLPRHWIVAERIQISTDLGWSCLASRVVHARCHHSACGRRCSPPCPRRKRPHQKFRSIGDRQTMRTCERNARIPTRSIFQCRQDLQHLTGPRSTENRIVFADLAIPEDQNALGELGDVVLVGDQHDR
jgi:hypothetical protein